MKYIVNATRYIIIFLSFVLLINVYIDNTYKSPIISEWIVPKSTSDADCRTTDEFRRDMERMNPKLSEKQIVDRLVIAWAINTKYDERCGVLEDGHAIFFNRH